MFDSPTSYVGKYATFCCKVSKDEIKRISSPALFNAGLEHAFRQCQQHMTTHGLNVSTMVRLTKHSSRNHNAHVNEQLSPVNYISTCPHLSMKKRRGMPIIMQRVNVSLYGILHKISKARHASKMYIGGLFPLLLHPCCPRAPSELVRVAGLVGM